MLNHIHPIIINNNNNNNTITKISQFKINNIIKIPSSLDNILDH